MQSTIRARMQGRPMLFWWWLGLVMVATLFCVVVWVMEFWGDYNTAAHRPPRLIECYEIMPSLEEINAKLLNDQAIYIGAPNRSGRIGYAVKCGAGLRMVDDWAGCGVNVEMASHAETFEREWHEYRWNEEPYVSVTCFCGDCERGKMKEPGK